MAPRYLFLFITFLFSAFSQAQIAKKRLPQNINVPTYTHVFPSLSGDGNQMIFLTNYTNSEGFETKYTIRNGTESWEDPVSINNINRPELDHIGSFCLSYDGNLVVFASRRTPTIGNFDIFISEKAGNYWTQPKNPGKPLNSPGNEGNPSLSPDGKSIYFTRCESMNLNSKSNCSIFVSHRLTSTRWSEPEKLPPTINMGHETTPRILADNKTLVFASIRAGRKGKLDLYQSTLKQKTWSQPRALSYVNTPDNDEYVSIPARGDIIYFTGKYRDQHNIYKAIIPEEFRPQKVMMITGTVTYPDGKKPSDDVLIQAFNIQTGEVYTTCRLRERDDSFTIFLPEGASYDISAFPQKGGHTYFSRIINLEQMLISKKEEWNITLNITRPGMTIPLSTIRFDNYTATISSASEIELKRIIGFLKKNPELRIEIGAYIDSLVMDSIPSNDLTEVIMDTIYYEVKNTIPKIEWDTISYQGLRNHKIDSLMQDSLAQDDTSLIVSDSLQVFNTSERSVNNSLSDSLLSLGYELLEKTDTLTTYFRIEFTYHNDRTTAQAQAVLERLVASGVPAPLLEAKGYGASWSTDLAEEERNYWIELKIIP